MNIEQAYQISLVDYLASLGHQPIKIKGQRYWYLSPYRNERTASFNVNIEKNMWYDFGTGEGGGIIKLVKLMYRTSDVSHVLRLIQEQSPQPINRHDKPPCNKTAQAAEWVNVLTGPLTSYPLLDYLKRRGIPSHIATRFCREVSYELRGKRYFSIGFLNDSGGYELRNPYFKGCMGKKDVTIFKPSAGQNGKKRHCYIFEGFFDFLSYMTLLEMGIFPNIDNEESTYIILNSVSNLSLVLRKLRSYDRIFTYLDNDVAGKKATEVIAGCYEGKVRDVSFVFDFYNDLNEYLCSFKDEHEGNKS